MPVTPVPDSAPFLRAVVVAGGAARRFGGAKVLAAFAGTTLANATVRGLLPTVDRSQIVVVGPDPQGCERLRATLRVEVVPDQFPGAGPVAGLATGLAWFSTQGPAGSEPTRGPEPDVEEWIALAAADQPLAGAVLPRLIAHLHTTPHADAVAGLNPDGHLEPLLALWRRPALETALRGGVVNRSLRDLLATAQVAQCPVSATECLDVDHPHELAAAEAAYRAAGLP